MYVALVKEAWYGICACLDKATAGTVHKISKAWDEWPRGSNTGERIPEVMALQGSSDHPWNQATYDEIVGQLRRMATGVAKDGLKG